MEAEEKAEGKELAPMSTKEMINNPIHINYKQVFLKRLVHGSEADVKFCISNEFSGSVNAACTRNRAGERRKLPKQYTARVEQTSKKNY